MRKSIKSPKAIVFDPEGRQKRAFGKFYENIHIRLFLHAEFRCVMEIHKKTRIFGKNNNIQKSFTIVVIFFFYIFGKLF